uniref:Uncharacterized protein n=1 Tax=Strongyloides venezuelensis TaxID=75913 RepID=A0A0K0G0D4_STRVS
MVSFKFLTILAPIAFVQCTTACLGGNGGGLLGGVGLPGLGGAGCCSQPQPGACGPQPPCGAPQYQAPSQVVPIADSSYAAPPVGYAKGPIMGNPKIGPVGYPQAGPPTSYATSG